MPWLVPSDTIRIRTVHALGNTRRPCRQALDEAFSGGMRVLDIADFTRLRLHDLRDHRCVVLGIIRTPRVRSAEGRKAYAHNEHPEPRFAGIPETAPGLERRGAAGSGSRSRICSTSIVR